jgi:hypothetical protein
LIQTQQRKRQREKTIGIETSQWHNGWPCRQFDKLKNSHVSAGEIKQYNSDIRQLLIYLFNSIEA